MQSRSNPHGADLRNPIPAVIKLSNGWPVAQCPDHARIVLDASGTLANCLKNVGQATETARQVRDLEHRGDAALRKICRLLHRSFITPSDSEDIHHIASLSDEILDHLDAVAYRIEAYEIARSRQQISEVSSMVHECVQAEYSALETL